MRIAPWPPTRYSPPLTPDFSSVFGRFRAAFRIAWQEARGYALEDWQETLLCHITEIDPATGYLRHRQYLVSVARQNGKTELAAALGLLWLLWQRAPYIVGIATSAEQARLVYDRTLSVIRGNPSLSRRFDRLTDTRGLRSATGGVYEIKASKSAALQGLPVALAVVDEVHLVKPQLWSDFVSGTGSRPDALVAGITTAGDDGSELLKHLYALADKGEIGYSIWEAPEAVVPEDDETLGDHLRAASPALASGRLDLTTTIKDVRTLPEADVVRYRLNRFVSHSNAFISAGAWAAAAWGEDETFPRTVRPVFAIDRTPEWSHAAIAVAARADDVTWTQIVASVPNPSMEQLADICVRLMRHSPLTFAMDRYQLGPLAEELRKRGLPVRIESQGGLMNASALLHSKVSRDRLRHGADPLLALQIPRAVRRNIGQGYRISRQDSSVEIDAVMATTLAVYAAEVEQDSGPQIY